MNWKVFEFTDGSNPFIAKTQESFWRMVRKYSLVQTGAHSFRVEGENTFLTATPGKRISEREKYKAVLREFAIEWQRFCGEYESYSYGEMLEYESFFATYGKEYGLLREFHENAIC